MDNNYYQVYLDETLALARSIVLKSDDTAVLLNDQIRVKYGQAAVDDDRPETWKYYLNVCGLYHFDNEVMQVVSMDTLQTIDFTLNNLQIHRATAKAYEYGSTQYKELVERFPNQERLILGILYPVEMTRVLEAQRGTILSYPPALVEEHEYTFINQLQEWIYSWLARYDNTQYAISDNLYKAAIWGMLFVWMVPAITMIRFRAWKTNEIHTYHLRQYLGSHGGLDVHLPYMTRRQALWLYRNIAHIERNSGKRSNFDFLLQHIMTERGIPLAAYQMRHNLSEMPGRLKPVVSFEKLPINTDVNYDMIDTYTPSQVYDKEDPLARDNVKYRGEEFPVAIRKMEYSLSNRLETKLLESTIIDYAGSEKYTLADTLVNHWISLAFTNRYQAYISFSSPVTDEAIVLSVKDAFVFYTYCVFKGLDLDTRWLPKAFANRVQRLPRPTLANIMAVVNPVRVPEEFGQEMLDLMPIPSTMISVDSFYAYCVELQKSAMAQYYRVCQEEGYISRGMKQNLVSRIWCNMTMTMADSPNQRFDDWFAARNIRIEDFTQPHLDSVADTILTKATGADSVNAITLKDIQDSMVRIMTQLSSYSVQYTASINTGPIKDMSFVQIRPEDIESIIHSEGYAEVGAYVLDYKGKMKQHIDLDLSMNTNEPALTQRMSGQYDHKLLVKPRLKDIKYQIRRRVNMTVGVGYEPPVLTDNPRRLPAVLGMDLFLAMPLEEQISTPDYWTD